MKLEKDEIEVLRHALYIHREMVRAQERLALNDNSDKGRRDAARFGKLIRNSLILDDKLGDMAMTTTGHKTSIR